KKSGYRDRHQPGVAETAFHILCLDEVLARFAAVPGLSQPRRQTQAIVQQIRRPGQLSEQRGRRIIDPDVEVPEGGNAREQKIAQRITQIGDPLPQKIELCRVERGAENMMRGRTALATLFGEIVSTGDEVD